MAGFFSKASSFLSSQAEPDAPASHGADKADHPEEARKPASSGAYGDLLAGAQTFINSSKPSDEGNSADKEAPQSHQTPGSGGYSELLASAQSFIAAEKPDTEGKPADKKDSGGYGDLLASAQSLMGSAKLSSGEDSAPVDKKDGAAVKPTGSGDSSYGDVYASAQVLVGAAKEGAAADMGEVAGATANLLGAATRYGNLEKTTYGDYAHKAQTYLQDYQASHGKASPQEPHKPSSATHDGQQESNPPPVSKSPQSEIPLKSSENLEDTEEEGSKNPLRSSEQD